MYRTDGHARYQLKVLVHMTEIHEKTGVAYEDMVRSTSHSEYRKIVLRGCTGIVAVLRRQAQTPRDRGTRVSVFDIAGDFYQSLNLCYLMDCFCSVTMYQLDKGISLQAWQEGLGSWKERHGYE